MGRARRSRGPVPCGIDPIQCSSAQASDGARLLCGLCVAPRARNPSHASVRGIFFLSRHRCSTSVRVGPDFFFQGVPVSVLLVTCTSASLRPPREIASCAWRKERKQAKQTQGRDGRTARRHQAGILKIRESFQDISWSLSPRHRQHGRDSREILPQTSRRRADIHPRRQTGQISTLDRPYLGRSSLLLFTRTASLSLGSARIHRGALNRLRRTPPGKREFGLRRLTFTLS